MDDAFSDEEIHNAVEDVFTKLVGKYRVTDSSVIEEAKDRAKDTIKSKNKASIKNLRGYTYKVSRNKLVDCLREQAIQKKAENTAGRIKGFVLDDATEEEDEITKQADELAILKIALNELPPAEKQLLLDLASKKVKIKYAAITRKQKPEKFYRYVAKLKKDLIARVEELRKELTSNASDDSPRTQS